MDELDKELEEFNAQAKEYFDNLNEQYDNKRTAVVEEIKKKWKPFELKLINMLYESSIYDSEEAFIYENAASVLQPLIALIARDDYRYHNKDEAYARLVVSKYKRENSGEYADNSPAIISGVKEEALATYERAVEELDSE